MIEYPDWVHYYAGSSRVYTPSSVAGLAGWNYAHTPTRTR